MALQRYHFDLGNSNKGPIGYCAAVWAENAEQAIEVLKTKLPNETEVYTPGQSKNSPWVEYINVYFNDDAITHETIDFVEDADEVQRL